MKAHSTLFSTLVARQILRDPERKRIPRMVWEVARCWSAKRERPGHYFKSLAYQKRIERPEGFLSQRETNALWALQRSADVGAELADKVQFQRAFERVPGIQLPRLLGHSEPGWFWSPDGTRHRLGSVEELDSVLQAMLSGAEDGAAIFAKPTVGQLGRGAHRLSSSEETGALWESVSTTPYIFQQAVRQHPALAAVMPDTLNTLRITTLREEGSAPVAASVWLKIGRSGAVADNGAGMLMMGVDMATGRLFPYAVARFTDGGAHHTHHPDTGVAMGGLQLPMFRQAVDMAVAAAEETQSAIVGWDIGIADDGPVVLEGNRGPSFYADEIANGIGCLDHPLYGPYFRRTLAALGFD